MDWNDKIYPQDVWCRIKGWPVWKITSNMALRLKERLILSLKRKKATHTSDFKGRVLKRPENWPNEITDNHSRTGTWVIDGRRRVPTLKERIAFREAMGKLERELKNLDEEIAGLDLDLEFDDIWDTRKK